MPNTDNIRTRAIRKLIERRKALQDAYDALVASGFMTIIRPDYRWGAI